MAGGSYRSKDLVPRETAEIKSRIPRRASATRILQDPATQGDLGGGNGQGREVDTEEAIYWPDGAVTSPVGQFRDTTSARIVVTTRDDERAVIESEREAVRVARGRMMDTSRPDPLAPRRRKTRALVFCMAGAAVFLLILISAALNQRVLNGPTIRYDNGRVYDVQVGANLAGTWQLNQPMQQKVPIPTHPGPYSVLGKPTVTVDFINRVLASFHSPAAGKGQALYDLGVQYEIDPVFALAFFMHESTFGTAGEARQSLSLGNLRCIPNFKCQDNFAWFDTWEDGFKAFYELIRNLYVAQWGRTTVDDIIPKYAPQADHNDEKAYIGALKHAIDTWHAGVLRP